MRTRGLLFIGVWRFQSEATAFDLNMAIYNWQFLFYMSCVCVRICTLSDGFRGVISMPVEEWKILCYTFG